MIPTDGRIPTRDTTRLSPGMHAWLPALVAGFIALLCAATFARPQDTEKEDELDRLLRVARTGSPAVRPQAADRILTLDAKSLERLAARTATREQLVELGSNVVEILGETGIPVVRKRLWAALEDPDFPWRPAAARSLARSAVASETQRFTKLLEDRLGAVRVAAVLGVERLDSKDAGRQLRLMFDDPDDRVRRAAARLLDTWGHRKSLYWIAVDLERSDRFFFVETGRRARFEAMQILEERLGESIGYNPADAPDSPTNQAAILALRERLDKLTGGGHPPFSPQVLAGGPIEGNVLGLEIRSCRKGEIFLRWNLDDTLLVGHGRPARIRLPEGTTARLIESSGGHLARTDRPLYGSPGCDVEQFYRNAPKAGEAGGSGVQSHVVSKGPEPVASLRPESLDALVRELVATIPEVAVAIDSKTDAKKGTEPSEKAAGSNAKPEKKKAEAKSDKRKKPAPDPRLVDLKRRVIEALSSVGGPLEAADDDDKADAAKEGAPKK